jgi:hypothetical protein
VLFWAVTQLVVVIRYRRFGTTCTILKDQDGTIGCPENSVRINTTSCVIAQKSSVLIYFAAEARVLESRVFCVKLGGVCAVNTVRQKAKETESN